MPDCTSTASIFGRVGGVFGKHVRYVDADMLERSVKDKNKKDRHTLVDPEKIQRVLLYYLDKDDRAMVIEEHEKAIQDAVEKRDFEHCSKMQDYIDFLREDFTMIQDEKNTDSKEYEDDFTLTRDSSLYDLNVVRRLSKRPTLSEVFPNSIVGNQKSDLAIVSKIEVSHKEYNKERFEKYTPGSSDFILSMESGVVMTGKNPVLETKQASLQKSPLSSPSLVSHGLKTRLSEHASSPYNWKEAASQILENSSNVEKLINSSTVSVAPQLGIDMEEDSQKPKVSTERLDISTNVTSDNHLGNIQVRMKKKKRR